MNVRNDSPFYQLHLERPGQRAIRIQTKIPVDAPTPAQRRENRRLADLEYYAKMAELARDRLDLPGGSEKPTLRAFLRDRYIAWLERERPRSAAETIRRLEQSFKDLADLPLDALTPAVVERWRKDRATSPQTAFRELSDLRGLLTRAVEWHVLKASPLAALRLHKPPDREIVRYLTPEEWTRLRAALEDRDRSKQRARERLIAHRTARRKAAPAPIAHFADWLTPAVLLSLHTGIRRGELRLLTWDAIDWRAKTLTVHAATAKTGKGRRIPLNADALDALGKWKSQIPKMEIRAFIFPGADGKPLTHGRAKGWAAILKTAKIRQFRWHDLRHTFASWLVQAGVSLYQVKALMGHSSIVRTERYAHLAPDQSREAVARLQSQVE